MKKFIILVLAAVMVFTLASCINGNNSGTNNSTNKPSENGSAAKPDEKIIISDGSKVGSLQLLDKDDKTIRGIIITTGSGHHEYPAYTNMTKSDFSMGTVYTEYYMNEWIDICIDTDAQSVETAIVKNDKNKDYSKITFAEFTAMREGIEDGALSAQPDPDNMYHFGSFYLNPAYCDPGLYNLFFACNGKVVGMVQLTFIPELTE